ncbi:MAG: hypothetical protein J7K46_09585 [Bacteroidales bacterium]|nr:hypothetical protein [Bacteroidales bacterium]
MEPDKTNIPAVKKENPDKKGAIWLILFIVLLAIALGGLTYKYYSQKAAMVEMEEVLTAEKDSLTHQLENIMYQYDTLKTTNDTLNQEIQLEKKRIKYLLRLQASNAQKIKLYKREIHTLREIMKSYIRQIDSLNTRNKMLTEENLQISTRLQTVEKSKQELEKEKQELAGKVNVASVIMAKNIVITPLNKRGKEKNKIGKIFKLKTCFTLRENPIAEAGQKTVYLRIQRPDSIVLAGSDTDVIKIDGQALAYSAKRDVEYLNKDIDMCIYWNNDGSLISGKYSVTLYLEGQKIGESNFSLK